MTLWYRIKQSQVKALSNHFKKCFSQINAPCLLVHNSPILRICSAENQNWVFAKNPFQFGNNARFFAAPVQEKPKQRKDAEYTRLNEDITAQYVRLVTDEGHDIVPIHEALHRARTLRLDLVEVDREGKPPVCKLMDYHREKHSRELKKKELAKSKKSEVTLRTGTHKEVRIAVKIEQKDLQMKADAARKLMERGYRVKCMAVGKEGEDLGGVLSRLAPLIEDFSVVESGPIVERKQAFVIVRHIKFGKTKKGRGLKKIVVPPSNINSSTETSSHKEEDLVAEEPESEEEPPVTENRYKTGPANTVPPARKMNANAPDLRNSIRSVTSEPQSNNSPKVPPVMENRYKTVPANRVPPTRQMNANAPDLRNSTRPEPRLQNQGRERPFDLNTSSSPARENRYQRGPAEVNRYQRGPNPNAPAEVNRYQRGPNPNPPAEVNRYQRGPNPNPPAEVNRYQRGPNPNSPPSYSHGNRRPFLDRDGQDVNPSGSNDRQYDPRR